MSLTHYLYLSAYGLRSQEADHQELQDAEVTGVNKKVRQTNVFELASDALLMIGGVDHEVRKDTLDLTAVLTKLSNLKDTLTQLQKIGKAIKERD